jgi:uncharacterized protein (TIGR00288 family)
LNPWWLRPTAEGAQDETAEDRPNEQETPEPQESPQPAPAAERAAEPQHRAAAPAPVEERPEEGADEPREATAEPGEEGGLERRAGRPRPRSRRRGPRRPREAEEGEENGRGGPQAVEGRGGENRSGPRRRDQESDDEQDLTFDFSPEEIERISREIVVSAPERSSSVSEEKKIALFCDLENIAIGVRDSEIKKFDINLVLERLLEKGKIIVKKAYCDWERYSDYKRAFHEAAIEMIDIPQRYYAGKNSADIKMVVDAMDLSYSKEHLDTFALLSGDSDFSPLVSKLKENNKTVIGIGVKGASSALLIDNCDEFIYYEDVWRDRQKAPKLAGLNKKNAEAFALMVDAIQALARENKDVLWGSMIKQTMQRKKPSFNEGYYGYGSFSELLEDAERNNIVKLKKDRRSGTYIVTGFASRKSA